MLFVCSQEGKERSVEWSKAPEELQEDLKEHYTSFYNLHYPADTDSESDSENEGVQKTKAKSQSSTKKTFIHNSDSEQEFAKGDSSGIQGGVTKHNLKSSTSKVVIYLCHSVSILGMK